ncbi:MAG: tyrosine-type recombinase/integrase [Candidatus Thermoplasmatota archaeon]|nr:tyrosine-type recombinase/integrase [Candidatus Thermoplasmatota archaeon]
MNPSPQLDRPLYTGKITVSNDTLLTYLSLIEIQGKSKEWLSSIESYLTSYLTSLQWIISKTSTIVYLKDIMEKHNISYYRKQVYQIRKFLSYLDIDWAKDIKPPNEPTYIAKRITSDNIRDTLMYFNDIKYYLQIKAVIHLGASSGLRAEELYQLKPDDIDIDNRIIRINHDPRNHQTTKTKQSRISFFTNDTKKILSEYLTYFDNDDGLKKLFSQSHITRLFKDAPIQVKDLRKYFSQTWDRKGGQTSIKKVLMGHSLKGDVDLMHYNAQNPEDLKKIYDKVMNKPLME